MNTNDSDVPHEGVDQGASEQPALIPAQGEPSGQVVPQMDAEPEGNHFGDEVSDLVEASSSDDVPADDAPSKPEQPSVPPEPQSAKTELSDFSHTSDSYDGSNIEILEGLEAVRHRPGMYVGDSGPKGYQHCAFEIIDNGVDEALAGHCTRIDVTICADGSMIVRDDGRGVPVDLHPKRGIATATVVFTELHAGGKFNNGKANSSYKTSGGLHGVGASVVNALSEQLVVSICRDGRRYEQSFHRGVPDAPLADVGPSKPADRGTSVHFWLDHTIFKPEEDEDGNRSEEQIEFNAKSICKSLAIRSYLNPGLTITFNDERTGETHHWNTERFSQILDTMAPQKSAPILPLLEQTIEESVDGGMVTVMYAMRVQNERPTIIESFANGIHTANGGTHETGLKAAILRSYKKYAEANNLTKETLTSEDVLEGLVAAVAVRMTDPQFTGQTKDKLNNSYIRSIVDRAVSSAIMTYFEEHPKEARAAIARAERAARARIVSEKARETVERKSILTVGTLPGKLADCQDKNPENCELFVVEGDSAGGSAKEGRNRKTQAILPLRGKVANAKSASSGAFSSEEAKNLIIALGCGSISGKNFDITKLRYHKLIILTDADVDGDHIMALVTTLLHCETPELIRNGHVYVGQPPLFRVRKGKEDRYIRDQRELDAFFADKDRKGWIINRFKGLGEMNAKQLGDTTLDPKTRKLTQILYSDQVDPSPDTLLLTPALDENGQPVAEDIETMDENTFNALMGPSADNRKAFISANTTFKI